MHTDTRMGMHTDTRMGMRTDMHGDIHTDMHMDTDTGIHTVVHIAPPVTIAVTLVPLSGRNLASEYQ
jgi:hypothetical protein